MVRTATTAAPTKDRLLDAAESLMRAKGFAATTVDEICEAAKLTKGSFFHYFDSKEQLGKELLKRFCASAQQHMMEGAWVRERDPLKRVYGYIDRAIQMAKACEQERGCLLGTFAQEFSDTSPTMRSLCAHAFEQWAQRLKKDLDEAKAQHAPQAAFDTHSVAEHFIAVLEGSKILAKAKQDVRIEERSLRHFKRYVESLFT